ncbi:MAG: NfeD family protein [Thermodesulfobacteriota bacterium]|nr:NfeD family protein [Thermodesulfobacteriota bacterium]
MILSSSLIWFFVGVAFLIAELVLPGIILIFFAAGSWMAAVATWIFDIELTNQILIFLVSSLTLLFTLRKYSLKIFKGKTRDSVDDHYTDSKIGKTALVTKTIAPNIPGEIKVMGSFWRAIADMEIEEGRSVLIESQQSEDGLTFKVKPV